MKINYTTKPIDLSPLYKIMKEGNTYRFGINYSLQDNDFWFVINHIDVNGNPGPFIGVDVVIQKLLYSYLTNSKANESKVSNRPWASNIEFDIEEFYEKLGTFASNYHQNKSSKEFYETMVTRENLWDRLKELKQIYENKL